MKLFSNFGGREALLAVAIVLGTAVFIVYKVEVLGYTISTIQPQDGYFVRLTMDVRGSGEDCSIRVTLPLQSDRQTITSERQSSGGVFKYTISPNRVGRWRADSFSGSQQIVYSFFAQTEPRVYPLPDDAPIPDHYSKYLQGFLGAQDRIEADAPEIVAKAYELAPEGVDLQTAIRNIYDFCLNRVRYLNVRGPTEALTALKLGEASCNGKNRLMVALLRARGIPARMVNGLILESNAKRTTHAWTLARVGDEWVPFCPTNDYFAEIPAQYLELSREDAAVFTHTRHIGFDWKFIIQRQLSHSEGVAMSNASNPMNILHAWTTLTDYHISLELIMVILMIPIGASVVAFCKNVVGLVPFGTFMPALIAASFRDTGLLVGLGFFGAVIAIVSVLNVFLMRLRLLHVPRLVAIVTVVVMSILLLSVLGLRLGVTTGAAVSLFPMAILSLTAERFTKMMTEESVSGAFIRMATTVLVASLCFAVYSISWLQVVLVAFPELLLLNVAFNLVLGSWTGIRWLEYLRFRSVVVEGSETRL